MEKGKSSATEISSALRKLELDPAPKTKPSSHSSRSFDFLFKKRKPRRLVSLCLGVLGQHLEEIHVDLIEVAADFPPDIKLAILAIARRRRLLNDDVLIALAEKSWSLLDISGSDVTDVGLAKVAQNCIYLRAVDISRCENITAAGVSDLICHCRSLEILKFGGCPRSDFTARRCLSILKPKLNNLEEESWEELDSTDIGNGAESLRWLVWPKIDKDSRIILAAECPRITVNPKSSPIGFRTKQIPAEALADADLDHPIVEDIDPKTWAVRSQRALADADLDHPIVEDIDTKTWAVRSQRAHGVHASAEAPDVPIAERFRLAFVERDARLAPKRAKNERQRRRRAGREWVMSSADAKSLALASQASKFFS